MEKNTQHIFIKKLNFKKHLFGGNDKCKSEENYHKLLLKIDSDEQTYEISFLIGWCNASGDIIYYLAIPFC